VTVEECVDIAKKFGARLAAELGIPVFLYGFASERDYRKTMPQVRKISGNQGD
jgi:glutamate formiminotransferase